MAVILSVNALTKAYGTQKLIEGVDLSISTGDRIGLVGHNGCGKTTLLKLISGQIDPDGGTIAVASLAAVGYMDQYELTLGEKTVYDEALSAFEDIFKIEDELSALADAIAQGDVSKVKRQSALNEELLRRDGLTCRARARAMLLVLGFSQEELALPIRVLSGGQSSRLKLSKLLLHSPTLLLLDEPTNHLDIPGIAWLEDFLRGYKGAVLAVSHDRRFLDAFAKRTCELANGRLKSYSGGYTAYVAQKEQDAAAAEKLLKTQQREAARLEAVIEKQRSFNREKSVRAARSNEKRLERFKAGMVHTQRERSAFKLSIAGGGGGSDVLNISGLAKAYPEKLLFSGLDLVLRKGEKAFILGANASGKTTLLNIILGRISADAGSVTLGESSTIGYYEQTFQALNSEHAILDELISARPDLSVSYLRTLLGAFLFSGDDVFKKVALLSGGERARIALIKLLLTGPNFLLLDEPTNHLDIPSREAVEDMLEHYEGALMCITHDRYLINKLASVIYLLTPTGLTQCENLDMALELMSTSSQQQREQGETGKAYWAAKAQEREVKLKKGRQERVEQEIARCEDELEALERSLHESGSDYERALALTNQIDALRRETERLYTEWAQLADELK